MNVEDVGLLCGADPRGRELLEILRPVAGEILAWTRPEALVLGDWLEEHGLSGEGLLEQLCVALAPLIDWEQTPIGEHNAAALFGEPDTGSQCDAAPFARSYVVEIVHCHVAPGDYAETQIVAIFRLRGGGYAYVDAGCDTTGWDCQSGANWILAATLEELWPLIGDESRDLFGGPSPLQRP